MSDAWKCQVCQAPKGKPCRNTIRPGEPLPGRAEHFSRALRPTPIREDDE